MIIAAIIVCFTCFSVSRPQCSPFWTIAHALHVEFLIRRFPNDHAILGCCILQYYVTSLHHDQQCIGYLGELWGVYNVKEASTLILFLNTKCDRRLIWPHYIHDNIVDVLFGHNIYTIILCIYCDQIRYREHFVTVV